MSAVAALALLWLAAGVVLGVRWWSQRGPDAARRVVAELPSGTRFGRAHEDGSRRRLQAMLRAYAVGATLVGLGLATRLPIVLALGAVMVNLGTSTGT